MRRAVERCVVAVLPGLLLASLGAVAATAQGFNRVVIQVNDRIATLYDYETRLEDFRRELAANTRLPLAERRQRMNDLPDAVFGNLLDELLLLSRADQLGVVFTEEELDGQLRQVRERYGFDNDADFEAALGQTGTNLREFREQMRLQMRMNEVMAREVRSKIDVGEELARVYYRDHPEAFMSPQRLKLRELVVLEDSGLPAAQRRRLAESIRDGIVAGRALDELVAEQREAGYLSNVIELGWVAGGDLAPELEAAVWGLRADDVSEPVESRGGLHVLQVVERQDEGLRPFNDVAEQAQQRAANETFAERAESFLKGLEEQSYVRLEPPPEAADFRRVPAPLSEEPELPAAAVGEAEGAGGDAAASSETSGDGTAAAAGEN